MNVIQNYYNNKKTFLEEKLKEPNLDEQKKTNLSRLLRRLEQFHYSRTTTPEEQENQKEQRKRQKQEETRKTAEKYSQFYKDFQSPQDVISKSEYVLTLFYSPNCGFCKKVQPSLMKVKEFYDGMIAFRAWDCKGEHGDKCKQYQVSGYPHFILFKNEQEVGRLRGAKPQEEIEQFIDETTSKTLSFGGHTIR